MKKTLMADIPTEVESIDIEKKFMNRDEDILIVKRLGAMYEVNGQVLILDRAVDVVTAFAPLYIHVDPVKCANCG